MISITVCILAALAECTFGLKVMTIGDWGDDVASGVANQAQVAAMMDNWCGTPGECTVIIDTGDNFYPQGVTSPTDSRFETSWRNVYNLPNLRDKVWYISIGNHDHPSSNPGDLRELHQVTFGNTEPLWYFPDLWYDFYMDDGSARVHFVVIDTQSLRWGKHNPATQLQWLDDTLAASTGTWKVVVAHHPPYSSGNYGPGDTTIRDQVVPICLNRGVHIVLSGHDHNLQHITKISGFDIDYIISGGGGRGLYQKSNAAENQLNAMGFKVDYFGYHHGIIGFEFVGNTFQAQYIDKSGVVQYTINRTL